MATVTIDFYDGPSITDAYTTLEDAQHAYIDADWAACHAPTDQIGRVKRITLRASEGITIKTRAYPI